jgi:pyrroloquinoline quinone (PQQ) biosynthesis protein C
VFTIPISAFTMPIQAFTLDRSRCSRSADLSVHVGPKRALYRRFMRAVGFEEGAWDRVPALPATRGFISMHLDMTFRSWLEALGEVGPGHEWAIPRMFPYLVQGIERSVAVPLVALKYFRLHIDLDVEHGRALEAALLRWTTTDTNQEELRRGARRSLDARAAFWSALAEQLFPEARDLGLEGSQPDMRAS